MPTDRIIRESLRLDACAEGMDLRVSYSHNGNWKTLGLIHLVKIKPLAKDGMVQIKFKSRWGKDPKVQKMDVPGDIIVERERLATEADGPDAGEPVRRTATHNGVTYMARDPGQDVDALVAEAAEAQRVRHMDDRDYPGGMSPATITNLVSRGVGPDVVSYMLATAAIMSGADIRPAPRSSRSAGGLRIPDEGVTIDMQPARVIDAVAGMIEDRSAGIWPGDR